MSEPISMIFGTIQHRLILNTPTYSMFLKFIIQSGATWQKLIFPVGTHLRHPVGR